MSWFKNLFKKKPVPICEYEVQPFKLIVGDKDYIQDMWETHFPFDTDQPTGSSANETLGNGGEIR